MHPRIVPPLVVLALLCFVATARARADDGNYTFAIKDHRFEPPSLEIPAGKKVKLVLKNLDATAEEFDSDDLHREKVIPAGGEGVIFIGPLSPGIYRFVGEYNQATAKGQIVVK